MAADENTWKLEGSGDKELHGACTWLVAAKCVRQRSGWSSWRRSSYKLSANPIPEELGDTPEIPPASITSFFGFIKAELGWGQAKSTPNAASDSFGLPRAVWIPFRLESVRWCRITVMNDRR